MEQVAPRAFVCSAFQILGTDNPNQISQPMVFVLEAVWDGWGRMEAEEVKFLYCAVFQFCCVRVLPAAPAAHPCALSAGAAPWHHPCSSPQTFLTSREEGLC